MQLFTSIGSIYVNYHQWQWYQKNWQSVHSTNKPQNQKKSQSYGGPYWYQGREKETIAWRENYIYATEFETITLPVDFFLTNFQLNITEAQSRTGLSIGLAGLVEHYEKKRIKESSYTFSTDWEPVLQYNYAKRKEKEQEAQKHQIAD